ncbi:helix-turn-helix domain-containing protein [Cohnella panacarvi]|uniref:helix-turn-helix domain-containing protein n=1 Tax=Cohnella panacarvi TaxID=400776 RepID=UPI00047987FE|nr:AraC family transcriptional regulator [Cohnella panacarvi]
MKVNWYYRMILSYAPIFFVIVSSFIFIFFAILSSASESKYIDTNRAILQQRVQYTDSSLQLIERNIVKQMFKNELLQSFFNDTPRTIYDYFVLQRELIELSSTFPFANSIYLYNEGNGEFLTDHKRFTRRDFADKDYFFSAYNGTGIDSWTNPRSSKLFESDKNEQVVSILKSYPYPSARQGAVVVNVNVKSLLNELNELNGMNPSNGQERNSLVLHGDDNQPFQAKESVMDKPLFAVSEYTGWKFYAENSDAKGYSLLSALSNIWTLFGIAVIVLAIIWFTVLTHLNYKPIQIIMGKISQYTNRRSELGVKSTGHELKLIESAIDQLLEKTVDYEHLNREREYLRQRSLYYDLLMGHQKMSATEWEKQMKAYGKPYAYDRLAVVVFEIDRYAEFKERFVARDQYLLKYIVENALRELVEQHGLHMWHAWVHPYQIAAVIHLQSGSGPDTPLRICEEYRSWINSHLELTLSAGIGKKVACMSQIEDSYLNAGMNVSYKAAFGTNSIIDNKTASTKIGSEKLNWVLPLPEMAHLFRKNDPQWMDKLNRIFENMEQMLVTRSVIASFISSLVHQLHKEMHALSSEVQDIWNDEYADRIRELENTVETMEELRCELVNVMGNLGHEIEQDHNQRSHHSIAVQIKAYLDLHYSDPDLSLNQVSSLFGVSPKTASWIFKEEIGEKFIDYLLQVRLDNAKRMLLETDLPIQQIAEQVGYIHVISFHRAFKKIFELPPGEYRMIYKA